MKSAYLSIKENAFLGDKPHEATFTMLTLEDGSSAPLGLFKLVAVPNKKAAQDWAAANGIRIVSRSGSAIEDVALSREEYLAALQHNLVDGHKCPIATFHLLASECNEEIEAMRVAGIAAVAVAKLLYAVWKTFHA